MNYGESMNFNLQILSISAVICVAPEWGARGCIRHLNWKKSESSNKFYFDFTFNHCPVRECALHCNWNTH